MSHYEQRLQEDVERIRGELGRIAEDVAEGLEAAVRSLLEGDRALAARVVLGDLPVNRAIRRLDAECHAFVARHLPSAGHLRFVSAVLRLSVSVERVGDYAVTLGRETAQLEGPPPESIAREIDAASERVIQNFRHAIQAFVSSDSELARATNQAAKSDETSGVRLFRELVEAAEVDSSPVADHFALLVILNRLSRVNSQAKNICEQTIFAVSGETKAPKTYRILFVDEKDNAYTQLAKAYCARAYPESALYASAGWDAAKALELRSKMFLEAHGYDTALAPLQLEELSPGGLEGFDVIVALSPRAFDHIQPLPFRTTLIEWDLGERPDTFDQDRAEALLRQAHEELIVQARSLLETLRGEGAR
ncbi:MAG: PhoU domain-containing protein [Acidobacteriota bacterium]